MRLPSCFALLPLTLGIGCAAASEPVSDDVGDALAVVDACVDDCSADSDLVATRHTLASRAHDVAGTIVFVDDRTIALEGFVFDGGGIDVRAIVAPSHDALNDPAQYVVLSDDLRRPGGYDQASLTFSLPEGSTIDDFKAFSIWCVPFGASFGDVEW